MIRFADFAITYPDRDSPTLRDVNLSIDAGHLCLVTGATGSGKSTLLASVNGLVPHFTGGTMAGSVVVADRSVRDTVPGLMADLVGYVGQDPLRGFVAETVEYELAYGMEQAGIDPSTMRARVEEVLDIMGLADLRNERLTDLSGGEQQRVAIGAVLTVHPSVLVLDEPTSALDPGAAEDVLAAVTRLVHDLGLTVVLAEHRLERVIQYADQVVVIGDAGDVASGSTRAMMQESRLVPPIVDLGRRLEWDPLPLSVREARAHATDLRNRVRPVDAPAEKHGAAAVVGESIRVTYGPVVAVRDVTIELHRGEVAVVMGRNGSGKSSLFWALHGSLATDGGRVERADGAALVPQTPSDLLFHTTVDGECSQADADASSPAGTCRQLLDELAAGIEGDTHPRDLSEGQRLALVLATQLIGEPDLILLDEPTRGLDYAAKQTLANLLRGFADDGRAVALSTHDVEFAALIADRVLVMAEGEIITDGPARNVLTGTPLFAPQIAKALSPLPLLTVEQVEAAIA